jgi:XRE family aerobic/anaerobic benzoate catabolism transcriptional regulator
VSPAKTKGRPAGRGTNTDPSYPYLGTLGDRVREARARRGMTRKILSRDSGVSERYLAELEGGRGNVSITLLRQIASAMSVPLVDLVREEPEPSVELRLLTEQLGRLAPAELAAAARLIGETFSQPRGRQGRIALIGLRGAGKSTLGRGLAERLQVPFVELAVEIEREAGMSLSEIFDLWGQPAYRRHERRCLEHVIEAHQRVVITTGGSLVSEPGTYELLLNSCYTIWLRANPEEHMNRVVEQGDYRPMEGNTEAMEDLRRILEGRDPLYRKADTILDTSGKSVEESLDALVEVSRAVGTDTPA